MVSCYKYINNWSKYNYKRQKNSMLSKPSTSNKVSGEKNSYYFLNQIMSAQRNPMSELWNQANKLQRLDSPNQITKLKYTISNKHWKKTIQTILKKGSDMSDIEKKTLSFWLKMTCESEKYMRDRDDKEIIRFRNEQSKNCFIQKCKTSIHRWLKDTIFENQAFKEKIAQMKEKFLNSWLEDEKMINEEKDGDNSQSTDYPIKIESNNPTSEAISPFRTEENSDIKSKNDTDVMMKIENIQKEWGNYKEMLSMFLKVFRIPVAVPMKFEN